MNPRIYRWLLSLVVAACFPLAAAAQSAGTGGGVNVDLNGPGGGVHVGIDDDSDTSAVDVHAYRLTYDTTARGRTRFKVLAPRGLRLRVTRGRHTVIEDTIPVSFSVRGGNFYRFRIYGAGGKLFDKKLRARRGQLARLWVRAAAPSGGQVDVNAGGQVRVHAGSAAGAGQVDIDVGGTPPAPPPAPAPAPVAAPPPPAPAPAPGCMSDADLGSLQQALKAEDFSDGKLTVLGDFARSHAFCVAQVVTILGKLDFSEGKLKALRIMKPQITDPQNDYRIYQAFDFGSDKAKARKILSR